MRLRWRIVRISLLFLHMLSLASEPSCLSCWTLLYRVLPAKHWGDGQKITLPGYFHVPGFNICPVLSPRQGSNKLCISTCKSLLPSCMTAQQNGRRGYHSWLLSSFLLHSFSAPGRQMPWQVEWAQVENSERKHICGGVRHKKMLVL